MNGNQTDREGCVVVCVRARQYKLPPAGVLLYLPEGGQHRTDLEGRRRKRKKRSVCVILNISLRFLILSLSLSPPFKIQKNIVFLLSFLRIYYYSFNPLIRVSGSWLFFFLGSLKFLHTHTLRIHTPIKKKGEKIK